jgi:hypothetical protein
MAKQRLFPEPITATTTANPNQRFDALASKVLAVSKAEIDKREKQWKRARKQSSKRR